MFLIRRMTADDIPVVQKLLEQLGYRLDAVEIRCRFDAVAKSDDHAVMLGARNGCIVALCHVYARPALDKPPEAVVQALVVDQVAQGAGVGWSMMAAAEDWARDHGFLSVALGSHISRSAAHAFYKSLGYRIEATSHQFRKPFDTND